MSTVKKWVVGLVFAALVSASFVQTANSTITNTNTQTVTALGNGFTTNYVIGFHFQDNDQVRVYLQDESASPYTRTLLVYGAGAGKFTITGGDPGTTVVMGTAPSASQRVVIKRLSAITQPVDYDENSAFPANDHEEQMDKGIQVLQELNSKVDQKVGLNVASSATVPTFPDPYADRFILYNHAGTDLTYGPSTSSSLSSGHVLKYSGTSWDVFDLDSALAVLTSDVSARETTIDHDADIAALQAQVNVTALQADLLAHIADTANPHAVTAAQVGSATAQWNANLLKGIGINTAGIADGYIPTYDLTNNEFQFIPNTTSLPAITNPYELLRVDATGTTFEFAPLINASIDTAAAIARGKLASGTADHVLINDATGVMSSEAQLASTRGGTGQDFSASTGLVKVAAGTMTAATLVDGDVDAAAAVARSKLAAGTADHVLINDGSGNFSSEASLLETRGGTHQTTYATGDILYASATDTLSKLGAGTQGQVLAMGASTPGWSTISAAGTGSGGINYITNSQIETNSTGYNAYADAAGVAPVNGTGGSPTITCTRSTSSPLRGTGSLLITKDSANRQGEGCSYDFTIDATDAANGTTQAIYFDFGVASGTFVGGSSSDLQVFIYDVTNSQLIYTSIQYINGSPYAAAFQPVTTSVDYRLIVHQATTSAAAYTVKLDEIKVGPQSPTQATNVTDWATYTPTVTGGGTATSETAKWRRVGDTLFVNGSFSTGVTSGTGLASVSLPSGLSIDSNKLSYFNSTANNTGNIAGYAGQSTGSTRTMLMITAPSSSTTVVYFGGKVGPDGNSMKPQNGDAIWNDTTELSFQFSVPIVGWNATTSVSSGLVAAKYHRPASTQNIANNTDVIVDFSDVEYDSHAAVTTGASWKFTAPKSAVYTVNAHIDTDSVTSWAAGDQIILKAFKNGSSASMELDRKSIQLINTQQQWVHGSGDIYLVAGDYIDVRLYQNQGTTLTTIGNPQDEWVSITEHPGASVGSQLDPVKSTYAIVTSCASAPCETVVKGPGVTNINHPATGTYSVEVSTGFFSGPFACTVNPADLAGGSTAVNLGSGTQTAVSMTYEIRNTLNVNIDSGRQQITCTGPR